MTLPANDLIRACDAAGPLSDKDDPPRPCKALDSIIAGRVFIWHCRHRTDRGEVAPHGHLHVLYLQRSSTPASVRFVTTDFMLLYLYNCRLFKFSQHLNAKSIQRTVVDDGACYQV